MAECEVCQARGSGKSEADLHRLLQATAFLLHVAKGVPVGTRLCREHRRIAKEIAKARQKGG